MPLTAELIRDLEAVIPGFNRIPLTLSDFEKIAEKEKITLIIHSMPTHGWLLELDGRPAIAVNGRLSKGHQSFVVWHEYFHHLYHPGGFYFYDRLGIKLRVENQASTMASIALIPTRHLKRDLEDGLTTPALSEKYDLPRYVVDFRLKVYRAFRQLRLFEDM